MHRAAITVQRSLRCCWSSLISQVSFSKAAIRNKGGKKSLKPGEEEKNGAVV